jgi:hypothetical protein
MGKNGTPISVSEHLLEIRYKPNPKILDHRGAWVQLISSELAFSEWLIVENRVDIFDKPNKERVFVGFRNAGFTAYDVPTANYFPDKALKFLRFLFTLDGFENPIYLERIGVRYKFITPFNKGFEDLRERYSSRYLTLTDKSKGAFSAKLVDIGGSLNFVDSLGNFNTGSGPMAKEQMSQFINRQGNYPEVGLYFDIDYWSKPNKDVDSNELLRLIKAFASECWNRHDQIRRLICED